MIHMKKTDIARSFSDAATTYNEHAFLQNSIAKRLIEQLTFIEQAPRYILDLGCGTGSGSKALATLYPNATIFGVDIAEGMLIQARHLASKMTACQADMEQLPFQKNSFDLIFSNCTFQWSQAPTELLQSILNVLKPGGKLFFTTFGPSTLKEIRQAFATASGHRHVNEFLDMHHWGDALLKEMFQNPVVEREDITIEYDALHQLFTDLKKTGAHNIHPNRAKHIFGKSQWKQIITHYEENFQTSTGGVYATYEVIYGYAEKRSIQKTHPSTYDELCFPLHQLVPADN